jgi:hypothetical protein
VRTTQGSRPGHFTPSRRRPGAASHVWGEPSSTSPPGYLLIAAGLLVALAVIETLVRSGNPAVDEAETSVPETPPADKDRTRARLSM